MFRRLFIVVRGSAPADESVATDTTN